MSNIFALWVENIVIGYQNINFIHEQFDQYFTRENSDQNFKFTSILEFFFYI